MAPRKTRRGAAAPAGAQASPMRKKATAQLMKDKARHEKDVIPETPLSANASPAASSPVQRPARAGGAGGRRRRRSLFVFNGYYRGTQGARC